MKVILITPPAMEPVTRDEMKMHLRIDDDILELNLLESIISTARERAEHFTRRQIMSATWEYCCRDGFPDENFIKLPFGNLQNGVPTPPATTPNTAPIMTYKTTDGTVITMTAGTQYLVETNGDGCGRIVLPYGASWPSACLYPSNPVTIRFVCGWETAAAVPNQIKSAIKLIATKLYEARGDSVIGQTVWEDKQAFDMLYSYRLWDEFR